jgi:hypothetical protein
VGGGGGTYTCISYYPIVIGTTDACTAVVRIVYRTCYI